MADLSLHTAQMHYCVDRLKAGDRDAANELISVAASRLSKLATKMLGGFPSVRQQVEADDILQGALLRLLRSLKEVRPDSTRSFFNLAAVLMRRELVDLVRAITVRQRAHEVAAEQMRGDSANRASEPDCVEMDRWIRLHEAVESLPVDLREVFGLKLYHGWSQGQIAELLQISDRQVRRLWTEACKQLQASVGIFRPDE